MVGERQGLGHAARTRPGRMRRLRRLDLGGLLRDLHAALRSPAKALPQVCPAPATECLHRGLSHLPARACALAIDDLRLRLHLPLGWAGAGSEVRKPARTRRADGRRSGPRGAKARITRRDRTGAARPAVGSETAATRLRSSLGTRTGRRHVPADPQPGPSPASPRRHSPSVVARPTIQSDQFEGRVRRRPILDGQHRWKALGTRGRRRDHWRQRSRRSARAAGRRCSLGRRLVRRANALTCRTNHRCDGRATRQACALRDTCRCSTSSSCIRKFHPTRGT